MKLLFIILVLLPIIFFVFALIVNIYLIATGKMTREELAKKVALNKENQRKKAEQKDKGKQLKKKGSSLDYISYPSPLNNPGLWN